MSEQWTEEEAEDFLITAINVGAVRAIRRDGGSEPFTGEDVYRDKGSFLVSTMDVLRVIAWLNGETASPREQ